MLVVLSFLLAIVLLLIFVFQETPAETESEEEVAMTPEEQLLDAVMDRIGVTRWSEALGWYELQEAGRVGDGPVEEDTPVWVARGKQGSFHSLPICGSMKSPVSMTLREAIEEGRKPCKRCWAIPEADELPDDAQALSHFRPLLAGGMRHRI